MPTLPGTEDVQKLEAKIQEVAAMLQTGVAAGYAARALDRLQEAFFWASAGILANKQQEDSLVVASEVPE